MLCGARAVGRQVAHGPRADNACALGNMNSQRCPPPPCFLLHTGHAHLGTSTHSVLPPSTLFSALLGRYELPWDISFQGVMSEVSMSWDR